jgi:TolB-like protein
VQLINAVSGFHVWSQTYDRQLTDILKVQAEPVLTPSILRF